MNIHIPMLVFQIIGGIAAIIVLFFAAFGFMYYRSMRNWNPFGW